MVKIIIFSVYLYHAPLCMWIVGVFVVDSVIIDIAVYLYSVQWTVNSDCTREIVIFFRKYY